MYGITYLYDSRFPFILRTLVAEMEVLVEVMMWWWPCQWCTLSYTLHSGNIASHSLIAAAIFSPRTVLNWADYNSRMVIVAVADRKLSTCLAGKWSIHDVAIACIHLFERVKFHFCINGYIWIGEEGRGTVVPSRMCVCVVVIPKHCTVDDVADGDGADEEIWEIKWENECRAR